MIGYLAAHCMLIQCISRVVFDLKNRLHLEFLLIETSFAVFQGIREIVGEPITFKTDRVCHFPFKIVLRQNREEA